MTNELKQLKEQYKALTLEQRKDRIELKLKIANIVLSDDTVVPSLKKSPLTEVETITTANGSKWYVKRTLNGTITSVTNVNTNLEWLARDDFNTYTYDDALAKYGNKLPTREEFELAEKYQICEVLKDWGNNGFWSSSVVSSIGFAWYFYADIGFVGSGNRFATIGARCVGR